MSHHKKIEDTGLRKISISCMDLLIYKKTDGEYALNSEMLEFVRAISQKYRVYLLTNVAESPELVNKSDLSKIKDLLSKLAK
jgi:FMN phosphatase YigB (HAD superfamily)